MTRKLQELRNFLEKNFYQHHRVREVMNRGVALLEELFDRFTRDPVQMPALFQGLIPRWGVSRAAGDYLAGMTDRFVWTLAGVNPDSLRLDQGK